MRPINVAPYRVGDMVRHVNPDTGKDISQAEYQVVSFRQGYRGKLLVVLSFEGYVVSHAGHPARWFRKVER